MPTPGIVPSQPRTFKDNPLGKCLHESWQNADEIAQPVHAKASTSAGEIAPSVQTKLSNQR